MNLQALLDAREKAEFSAIHSLLDQKTSSEILKSKLVKNLR